MALTSHMVPSIVGMPSPRIMDSQLHALEPRKLPQRDDHFVWRLGCTEIAFVDNRDVAFLAHDRRIDILWDLFADPSHLGHAFRTPR